MKKNDPNANQPLQPLAQNKPANPSAVRPVRVVAQGAVPVAPAPAQVKPAQPVKPRRVQPPAPPLPLSRRWRNLGIRLGGALRVNPMLRVMSLVIVAALVVSGSLLWLIPPDTKPAPAQPNPTLQSGTAAGNDGYQNQGAIDRGNLLTSEDLLADPAGVSRHKIMPEDELELAVLAAELEAALLVKQDLMPAPTESPAATTETTTQPTTQATTQQTTKATTQATTQATTAAPTTEATAAPTEAPVAQPVRAAASNNRVIGYYGGWKSLEGYTPDNIDGSKLTHVLYAFAYIDSNMRIGMGSSKYDPSNFAKLRALKERNPHLKTLISVGGWDWSGRFSDAALTEESRTVFADSCVDFILKHGFDGVDLDWEYPVRGGQAGNTKRPEDKQNFTLLMKKIREKLDAQSAKDGRPYLLSFAGGGTAEYASDTELDKLGKVVDFAMLMSYDYHGKWDARTDFNAPLYPVPHSPKYQINYNINDTVNNWLNRGMPAEKLVIGIPFYGIKYTGVASTDNGGFYQDFDTGWAISYKDIAEKYLTNDSYTRHFHDVAKVPWLFDGSTFISYDDPESLNIKANYIRDRGLGGAMIWQLAQDDSNRTLLNALHDAIN